MVYYKIHAAVNALGNPLKFILTLEQRHDITQGINILKKLLLYLIKLIKVRTVVD